MSSGATQCELMYAHIILATRIMNICVLISYFIHTLGLYESEQSALTVAFCMCVHVLLVRIGHAVCVYFVHLWESSKQC